MIEDEDFAIEDQETLDVDFIIDPIEGTSQSISYGLYAQLLNLQNFYSSIQSSNKKICITWLVSSFIAIGYIFSKKAGLLPLNPLMILVIICLASITGISLLWFLDIFIYQTCFYGVVLETLKIEKKYKWFTKLNHHISYIELFSNNKTNQSNFYMGCNFILLFIITLACLFLVNFSLISSLLISATFFSFIYLIRKIMINTEHPKNKSPFAFIKNQAKEVLKK